ncbi:hypothetical protein GC163_04660 [bacterium]|nr:hypothetical protein [bacterium]
MISFDERPPSTNWEAISLGNSSLALWSWFKPTHAPHSVAIRLPPELWQTPGYASLLTIRELAEAAGIDWLIGWTLYGQYFPVDERTAAYLDMPLTPAAAGIDPLLILWSQPVAMPQSIPAMAPAPAFQAGASDLAPGEDPRPYWESMAYHWDGFLKIENDLRRIRMQLEQSASRLSSLNRDLNSDEANAADNLDKKDWQDARRFLRDSASVLSRSIKEIDVGLTSGAGQRHKFADIVSQYLERRVPFVGMKQTAVDFEMYHRSAQNTLSAAQSALTKGSADGERRASLVLNRIAGKVRQKRNKARGMNS